MDQVIVMMSTFNGAEFLKEQLDSIYNQVGDFVISLYVRDDGSTDKRTLEILNMYENDDKLVLIKGKNRGSAESFKELLKKIPTANFYAFSDQDDVWMPNKIQSALSCMRDINCPCLYGSKKIIVDKNLKKIQNADDYNYNVGLYNMLIQGAGIAGCTMVFNNALRQIFLNCPENDFYHDELMVMLAETYGKVIFDTDAKMYYRNHAGNVFGSRVLMQSKLRLRANKILKFHMRNKTTKMAMWLLNLNINHENNVKWSLIKCAAGARYCIVDRLRLAFYKGLKTNHIYEYFMYKSGILLGWI